MKGKRLLAAIVSLAAAAIFAVPSGALITPVSSPAATLTSSDVEWTIVLDPSINGPVENMSKIDLVVTLTGGTDQYKKERTNGKYDDGNDTKFVELNGFIGIGSEIEGTDNKNWHQFGFKSLDDVTGGTDKLTIRYLGNDKYLLTGEFGNVKVHAPDRDVTIALKEWGNKSPNYSMTVDEMYVYGPDGNVAIYADAAGNLDFGGHAGFSAPGGTSEVTTAAETEPPETTATEETTEETTTEETTAEETTEEETSETEAEASETEETTTVTTTSAATTTTTTTAADNKDDESENIAETSAAGSAEPAQTTAQVKKSSDTSFGSRDSTLIIVGVVAGVIIVGVIAALIIMISKKKK